MASIFIPENEYSVPYWIANHGNYMDGGKLNPDAFDPQAPNAQRKGKHYTLLSSGADRHPDPFDLDNLLFIDRKKVEDFLEKLEKAAANAEKERKFILPIISMGGTLTMSYDEHGRLISNLAPQQLIDAAGSGISENYIAVGLEMMQLDSSQYEYAYTGDLTIVAAWIWTHASGRLKDKMTGFLVPHGTDTKVESATNTMTQLGPNLPFSVGMVSAQRDLGKKPNDVGTNVYLAATMLELFVKRQICTAFVTGGGSSGGALNPAFAQKTSDTKVRAFESPFGPPIAESDNFVVGGVRHPFQEKYKPSINIQSDTNFYPFIIDGYRAVTRIGAEVGRDPRLVESTIRYAIEKCRGTVGILLTTFGAFTDNNKTLNVIARLKNEFQLMLFATSPFAQGNTHDYESAKRLQEELGGIITRMSPAAASTIITMGSRIWPDDKKKIAEFVTEWDYAGLQPPLPNANQDSGYTPIKHIGIPPDLSKRTPV